MATVEFGSSSFNVDEDGFIEDFNAYNKDWVQLVKKEEGIDELTEEHWKVINVLQDYYKKKRHCTHGPYSFQTDRFQTETHL